ncbi:hypothetical protein ACEPAF_4124 [Sanghuangporus sanghuang]
MSLSTLPYDSQLDTDHWKKLELTSSDPCRTDIVDADSPERVLYKAKTKERGPKPITTYTDASGNIIATLEWHLRLSDKLSVRDRPKQNVGKWLKNKRSIKGRSKGSSFTDKDGREYTWRNSEAGSGIYLSADESDSSPIAMFIPRKGRFGDPNAQEGTILLSKRAAPLGICDEIVLSALLLEKARRFSGRQSTFSSGGVATAFGIGVLFTGPFTTY